MISLPGCNLDCIDNDAKLAPSYDVYPRLMGLAGLAPPGFFSDIENRMACALGPGRVDLALLILKHVTCMLRKKVARRTWWRSVFDDMG